MSFGRMGGMGRGFGRLGSPLGGTTPSWVLRSSTGSLAKFQRDAANGRYWFNGRSYASEAAFLTAVGGVTSSNARVFGPYLDPTNTNLLTNGDFSDGTTGWAGFGTGVSIANASGEMQLTSGGSLNGFAQSLAGTLTKAYQLTGTGRQGTSTNTFFLGYSLSSSLTGGFSATGYTTTSNVTRTALCASSADTMYFGIRNSSGSGAGTAFFDNFSLVQVWPFNGWAPGAISVLVEATTPTGAGVDQVIWQGDVQNERDRIRLVRLTADNHIHLIVTANNLAQADLDLGAVADNTFFSIAFSAATNLFSASLNGGAPVIDSSGVCPGLGIMQIGKSFTGNAWTGTDPLVAVF